MHPLAEIHLRWTWMGPLLLGVSLLPLSFSLIGFFKSRVVLPTSGPHTCTTSVSGLHKDSRERSCRAGGKVA